MRTIIWELDALIQTETNPENLSKLVDELTVHIDAQDREAEKESKG